MTDHARSERRALADLLDAVGPDAPTLCRGWTTADLAAHLVVREGDLRAAPGILISPLAERTSAAMRSLVERLGYPAVVDRFRTGPPRWSPARIDAVDRAVNTAEFFVHHEDVRRAQESWQPRELPDDLEEYLWRRTAGAGRFLLRKAAVGVVLAGPGRPAVRVRRGDPAAVVSGPASELTLYLFGRRTVAQVDVTGPGEAVDALAQTPLGI
jgi:uncharacterized protein (TIGR03085 family)